MNAKVTFPIEKTFQKKEEFFYKEGDMKKILYFALAAAMLLPSGAYAAMQQAATIRSISYYTLEECTSNALAANASACVSDGTGGYYFEPVDDLPTLDITEPQIKCWNLLSGCNSACTSGTCLKDSTLNCYTCEPKNDLLRICTYASQSACNSDCTGGTCRGSGTCYNCLLLRQLDPIDFTVDPVSSCPSGTTKDASCECCVNN